MTISDENKKFLEDLLQYYIDQADSYSQIASEYGKFSKSKREVAFGVIVGTMDKKLTLEILMEQIILT